MNRQQVREPFLKVFFILPAHPHTQHTAWNSAPLLCGFHTTLSFTETRYRLCTGAACVTAFLHYGFEFSSHTPQTFVFPVHVCLFYLISILYTVVCTGVSEPDRVTQFPILELTETRRLVSVSEEHIHLSSRLNKQKMLSVLNLIGLKKKSRQKNWVMSKIAENNSVTNVFVRLLPVHLCRILEYFLFFFAGLLDLYTKC